MSLNLRRYARLGVLGFLIVYFTAQALTGERGLLNDGERWWVVSIFWDSERATNPIPERYLRTDGGA